MNKLIQEALAYERENNIEQSIRCLQQALEEYPNDKDVLYYFGILLFNTHKYGEALDAFIASYNHKLQTHAKKEEILTLILDAYCEPNKEKFKRTYEDNVKNFLSYKRNYIKSFPVFEDLRYICIPKSNYEFHIFDKHTRNFEGLIDITQSYNCENIAENDFVMAIDIFDLKQLEILHRQTTGNLCLYDSKIPIYVIWNVEKLIKRQCKTAFLSLRPVWQRCPGFSEKLTYDPAITKILPKD